MPVLWLYHSGMSIGQQAFEDYEKAYYAESRGNLVEALRLYQLVLGYMVGRKRVEKDGMVIETGSLEGKIDRLEVRVNRAAGHGKVRRIPIEHMLPVTDAQ